jgi:hypothetical protein
LPSSSSASTGAEVGRSSRLITRPPADLIKGPIEKGITIHRQIESVGVGPVSSLDVVVLLPFQLYICPHVLRLPARALATLTDDTIQTQFKRTVIDDA